MRRVRLQPMQDGDQFGQCPECGEMWCREGDRLTCSHCGWTLNLAAAPDLLEACKAALLREDISDDEVGDLIHDAIAKAEGKE